LKVGNIKGMILSIDTGSQEPIKPKIRYIDTGLLEGEPAITVLVIEEKTGTKERIEEERVFPINDAHHMIDWYRKFFNQEVGLEIWITEEILKDDEDSTKFTKFTKYSIANVVGSE
jgi:hypothetical protein